VKLSEIIMEINNLHKTYVGNQRLTGVAILNHSVGEKQAVLWCFCHSPLAGDRHPYAKERTPRRLNGDYYTICYWDCKYENECFRAILISIHFSDLIFLT
jgi:hypothetical protein